MSLHIQFSTYARIGVVIDYIPVLSTFNNLFDLFTKAVLHFGGIKLDSENHTFRYIQNKCLTRTVLLNIPVLGNIIVAIHDIKWFRETQKSMELGHQLYQKKVYESAYREFRYACGFRNKEARFYAAKCMLHTYEQTQDNQDLNYGYADLIISQHFGFDSQKDLGELYYNYSCKFAELGDSLKAQEALSIAAHRFKNPDAFRILYSNAFKNEDRSRCIEELVELYHSGCELALIYFAFLSYRYPDSAPIVIENPRDVLIKYADLGFVEANVFLQD